MINSKTLVALIKMQSGCDYHRLQLPLENLGINIADWSSKKLGDMMPDMRILLFNRTPGPVTVDKIVELKKKKDFKIVVDLDDFYELYPMHILYRSWYASKTNIHMQDSLRAADAVIVTTQILADKIKHLNSNIHVINNALPYDYGQFNSTKEEDPDGLMRFLYAGGSSHFYDIQILKKPFSKTTNNQLFKKARFILAGFDTRNKESEIFWGKMENTFSVNHRVYNFAKLGTKPLHEYMDHYKQADINLIPLEGNSFNACKSYLKILEAGAKNIPCIASNVSPYIDFPRKDLIMYAHNTASWYEHLKYCVENPTFVKESGLALGEYCRQELNLTKANEHRRQLFEHLMK